MVVRVVVARGVWLALRVHGSRSGSSYRAVPENRRRDARKSSSLLPGCQRFGTRVRNRVLEEVRLICRTLTTALLPPTRSFPLFDRPSALYRRLNSNLARGFSTHLVILASHFARAPRNLFPDTILTRFPVVLLVACTTSPLVRPHARAHAKPEASTNDRPIVLAVSTFTISTFTFLHPRLHN